jgi:predicted XRE-type DNA-binding protein
MTNKSFRDLYNAMSPQAREEVEAEVQQALAEMPIQEFRQARKLSQEEFANILQIKQASVFKLERHTDIYIGLLRRYIEAMGGVLDIIAHFPDGEVRINHFSHFEDKGEPQP